MSSYQNVPDPYGHIKTSSGDSNWSYIVTGAAVTNFTITLPSRPDWARILAGRGIYVPGGSDELFLLAPNGETASTSNVFDWSIRSVGSNVGTSDSIGLLLCSASSAPHMRMDFKLDLDQAISGIRFCQSFYNVISSGPQARGVGQVGGLWTGSGGLTTVQFKGSLASGVGVGTRVRLWWEP